MTSTDTLVTSGSPIALRGLVKHYGTTRALDDVSLDIPAGSFTAILGPSGSGKTTLLNALGGFVSLDSGVIEVSGVDMAGVEPSKRGFGYVFQQYALFPHMTIAENIAFPLVSRKMNKAEIKKRVGRMLEMVELSHVADRAVNQLSGGQQQRIALARALVYEPDVLLLDEPLAALDRRLRETLRAELRQIHDRVGSTFVLVTHDQEEAMSMADQIVVMRDGRVEQVGTPAEVYDTPATEFVATFLGDCNLLAGTVDSTGDLMGERGLMLARGTGLAPGTPGVATVRPESLRIVRGAPEPNEAVVRAIVDSQQFMGREVLIECTTELGRLQARVPRSRANAHAEEETRPGCTIQLGWTVEDVHVISTASSPAKQKAEA